MSKKKEKNIDHMKNREDANDKIRRRKRESEGEKEEEEEQKQEQVVLGYSRKDDK